jgi:hypothetical protein
MRGEVNTSVPINADGVGQLDLVRLYAGPDLGGGQFCGRWSVVEAAHRDARAEQFFPEGRVGKTGVVDERIGLEQQAVAVHGRRAVEVHLDADAGEGAALGEVEVREPALQEIHLAGLRGQKARVRAALSPLLLTVKIWPSVLCQNWFSFMGLASLRRMRGLTKPGLAGGGAEIRRQWGLIFAGWLGNFAPFTAQNHPGRFPTGPPPSK